MEIQNRIEDLEAQTEADQNLLRIEERRKTNKALHNFQKNSPNPPEVRALVAKNVFYEGSMTSVWRILNAEKKAIEGEPAPRPQKRGRKSPLVNPEILTFDDITTRVSEKFLIETSSTAIKGAGSYTPGLEQRCYDPGPNHVCEGFGTRVLSKYSLRR